MFADHVEAEVLKHLEIIHHGLTVGRRVQTIGPVALVKGTENEDEIVIQKRADDAVNLTGRDGAETGVTQEFVVTHLDREVVQVRG